MEFFGVSVFDLTVLAVFSLSALIGLATGFVRPVFFIAAWLVAGLLTFFVFPHTEAIAAGFFSQTWAIKLAAGLVPFLIVLAVLSIVGQVLSQKVQKSGLGNVDKALGAVAGVAVGSGILGVMYLALQSYYGERPHPDWIAEAVSRPYVEQAAGIANALIPYDALDDPQANLRSVSDAIGEASDDLAGRGGTGTDGLANEVPAPPAGSADQAAGN